jgi:6-phosphogluconolactonase
MGFIRSDLLVVDDSEALSLTVAEAILVAINDVLGKKPQFSIALSGGSTPKQLYILLASDPFRSRVPWDRVHFFWGDERHVPPDHAESNYRMAKEAMLSKVSVPPGNVHRVLGEERDAGKAASMYEEELRAFFRLETGQLPRFDLVLLGLGPDGHTASLFPETRALHEQQRLVVDNWVVKTKSYRITMTPPVLNQADRTYFLVSGGEKAEMLREVLEGTRQPDRLPAQLIQPVHGKLRWFVDREAAKCLHSKT